MLHCSHFSHLLAGYLIYTSQADGWPKKRGNVKKGLFQTVWRCAGEIFPLKVKSRAKWGAKKVGITAYKVFVAIVVLHQDWTL